jgi:photosystem II stability/assembly factor-like uncharacterized protein
MGHVCASVGGQVFCSNDGGENWQVLVENLPDIRSLVSV